MSPAHTRKQYAIGASFLLALALIFFWDNISGSDLYQRTVYPDRWEQRQRDVTAYRARLDELDRQICAIYIGAAKDALPIDIERDTVLGIGYDKAVKIENEAFEFDRQMCEKHGISLRSRTPPKP